MNIARVIGHVYGTVKDARLSGMILLVVNVEDGRGNVLDRSVVAVDTCSAGLGDVVLLVRGSASRLPEATAGAPVDAAIVAILDEAVVSGAGPAKKVRA